MILFLVPFNYLAKFNHLFAIFFSSFSFIFWKILIVSNFLPVHANAWTIHGSVSIDCFFPLFSNVGAVSGND